MSRRLRSKQLFVALSLLALSAADPRIAPAHDVPAPDAECDLTIKLAPAEKRLEASGRLRLRSSRQARETVAVSLRADMADLKIEVLSPPACAGLAEVRAASALQSGPDRDWTIRPKHPFPAGSEIRLKFSYAGGKNRSQVYYLGKEGCFAGGPNCAWYPKIDTGRYTGTLRFEVPRGFVVKATGNPGSTRDEADKSVFEFAVTRPSTYSFAAARYLVRRHEGKVPTTLYLLNDRPFADQMATGLGQVLDVLVREFGPYPYGNEFAIVETPSPQSEMSGFSGASIEGFMFVTTFSLRGGFNLALFGHELSHQWWGNLVKHSGGKGAFMLDEALAQFGSLRCVEELEGPAAAARYRWSGYPGYANVQCGRGALRLWATGRDHSLDDLPTGSLVSHNLADSKGFLVYHLLGRTIGPDRFRKALHEIVERHAFGTVSWAEFLQTVQEAAGGDMSWFYEEWFTRTGAPVFSLEWRQEKDRLRCTIRQEEPMYRVTVPISVTSGGKTASHDVEVSGKETEFVLPARERVSAVALDPDYHVYHMTPAIRDEFKKPKGR